MSDLISYNPNKQKYQSKNRMSSLCNSIFQQIMLLFNRIMYVFMILPLVFHILQTYQLQELLFQEPQFLQYLSEGQYMKSSIVILFYILLFLGFLFCIPTGADMRITPTTLCEQVNNQSHSSFQCVHCFNVPQNISTFFPINYFEQKKSGILLSFSSCIDFSCNQAFQIIDINSTTLRKENIKEVDDFLKLLEAQEVKIQNYYTPIEKKRGMISLTKSEQLISTWIDASSTIGQKRFFIFQIVMFMLSVIITKIYVRKIDPRQTQGFFILILPQMFALMLFLNKYYSYLPKQIETLLLVAVISVFIINLHTNSTLKKFSIGLMFSLAVLSSFEIISESVRCVLTLILVVLACLVPIKVILFDVFKFQFLLKLAFLICLPVFHMVFVLTAIPIYSLVCFWIMHSAIPMTLVVQYQQNDYKTKGTFASTNLESQQLTQL